MPGDQQMRHPNWTTQLPETGLLGFFQEIAPDKAIRGDIVMFDGDDGKTLGVLWANKIWAVTEDGARPVNHKPIKAWRVE